MRGSSGRPEDIFRGVRRQAARPIREGRGAGKHTESGDESLERSDQVRSRAEAATNPRGSGSVINCSVSRASPHIELIGDGSTFSGISAMPSNVPISEDLCYFCVCRVR